MSGEAPQTLWDVTLGSAHGPNKLALCPAAWLHVVAHLSGHESLLPHPLTIDPQSSLECQFHTTSLQTFLLLKSIPNVFAISQHPLLYNLKN
jgi:hypothetical protein